MNRFYFNFLRAICRYICTNTVQVCSRDFLVIHYVGFVVHFLVAFLKCLLYIILLALYKDSAHQFFCVYANFYKNNPKKLKCETIIVTNKTDIHFIWYANFCVFRLLIWNWMNLLYANYSQQNKYHQPANVWRSTLRVCVCRQQRIRRRCIVARPTKTG